MTMSEPRLDYAKAFPEGIKALAAFGHVVNTSGLEHSLMELVKMRSSQLNGCAYCIDMHSKDAIAGGETPQRLFALDAWREGPFFTPREQAAIAWTEAITNIQQGHAPEAIYQMVKAQFSEDEIVKLTLAITLINSWNRIAIAFRPAVGGYQPCTPKVKS
jgi:AhpD family alkylhydroperoxidase